MSMQPMNRSNESISQSSRISWRNFYPVTSIFTPSPSSPCNSSSFSQCVKRAIIEVSKIVPFITGFIPLTALTIDLYRNPQKQKEEAKLKELRKQRSEIVIKKNADIEAIRQLRDKILQKAKRQNKEIIIQQGNAAIENARKEKEDALESLNYQIYAKNTILSHHFANNQYKKLAFLSAGGAMACCAIIVSVFYRAVYNNY